MHFTGTLDDVARANLWLRTASRVIARLAGFRVRALGELERKAATLPWQSWLPAGVPVALSVSCRKSRLYHQKAVAERIARAIVAAGGAVEAGGAEGTGEADGIEETRVAQLLLVRIYRDELTLSLDSSGELLHRRGYRQAVGRAPLRETLAAALLLASEWQGETSLVDPFCGSGTIPIEAAMIARRLAPGRHRHFAFERWPGWRAERWAPIHRAADAQALAAPAVPIIGADRDAGAIAAATANATRAGVLAGIEFRHAALSALEPPPAPGTLVSNPPYGVRVSESRDLRDLFARLGQVARRSLAGWRLTLLLPETPLERETGLDWHELFRTHNGGLAVRALRADVPKP